MTVVGNEDHSNATRQGMLEANTTRDQWKRSLASGETSFHHVVDLSRSHEYRALSLLKLIDLLSSRSGWTEMTAHEALMHAGFEAKDTIRSIRRSKKKIDRFATLMEASPGQWRARPSLPEGWPWKGKLSLLVNECERKVPTELIPENDDGSEFSSKEDETRDSDNIARLMMEGDEDE